MADIIEVNILNDASVEMQVGAGGSVPAKWDEWNAEGRYNPLNCVSYDGSSYICLKANGGRDPEADVALGNGVKGEYWLLIAKEGAPFTYDMFTEEQLEALRGPEGPQGVQGIQGIPGERGPQGVQGIQGIQGERGVQGERGERGEPFTYDDFTPEQLEALRGPEGPAGRDGQDGSTGPRGPAGRDGQDGEDGPRGPAGRDGNDGATFYPSVDADGNLSWTNDGGLENPSVVNVRGPQGERGPKGDPGEGGEPEIFIATYGETTYADIRAAHDAGKMCFCLNGTTTIGALMLCTAAIARFSYTALATNTVLDVNASDVWTKTTTALLSKAGGAMSGPIQLAGDPTEDLQAATKQYVDAHAGGGTPEVFTAIYGETLYEDIMAAHNEGKLCVCNYNDCWHFGATFTSTIRFTAAVAGQAVRVVSVTGFDVWEVSTQTLVKKNGDSMTGYLTLHADPTDAMHAATKQYVDNKLEENVELFGNSLPIVNETDNGKFLRVVNGAWAAAALESAEGGGF